MDTDKLRYFVTIAESGGLSKAAKVLGISHSGLSKAVSALEDETSLTLFRPLGRGLEITPEGKWFYEKARAILAIAREIEQGVVVEKPTLRVAMSSALVMTCAGFISREMKRPLSLLEIEVGEIEGQLIAGELDFGIAFVPSPRPELEYLEIGSVKFSPYAREDLAKRFPSLDIPFAVPASEFPTNPLGYRNRDGWPLDVSRNEYFRVNSFATALDLLRSGEAALYLPEFVAHLENTKSKSATPLIHLSDFKKAETKRKLFLVKRHDAGESPEMKKATKVIRQQCCSRG